MFPNTNIGLAPTEGVLPQTTPDPQTTEKRTRIICVASGKGGTGKSFVSAYLTQQFAKFGKKVLLVDADFGLSNAHLYLGLKPTKDITALFDGVTNNSSVLLKGLNDLHYLYGGSGLANLAQLSTAQWSMLLKALAFFEQKHSHIIIDLAAGIGKQVVPYLVSADEVVLVVNPDPLSILDAFATIKVLKKYHYSGRIYLISNRTNSQKGEKAADILKKAAVKLTPPMSLYYLGSISESMALVTALRQRQSFLDLFPFDPASVDLKKIAKKLLQLEPDTFSLMDNSIPYFQKVRGLTN